jgi:rhomboid family GlyGly-CTERM serine protease
LLITGATLLASTSGLAPLVEFSRKAIMQGELWRLFTGHLSHWSLDHLQWDLASFVLLGAIAERNGRTRFIALVAASALAISIGLLVAQPDLDFYRGLSGVDSALFVLVCASALRTSLCSRDRLGTALTITLLAGFIGKVGLEAISGRPLFMAEDPGAALVWLAHASGGAAGCLVAARGCAQGKKAQSFGSYCSQKSPATSDSRSAISSIETADEYENRQATNAAR